MKRPLTYTLLVFAILAMAVACQPAQEKGNSGNNAAVGANETPANTPQADTPDPAPVDTAAAPAEAADTGSVAQDTPQKPAAPKTGVKGSVFWLEGNQMPSITPDGQESNRNPKGEKVDRTLYIYEATTMTQAEGSPPLYTKASTRLVKKVETKNGDYNVALPPGEYTIFTLEPKENNALFASEFRGQYINPVTVPATGFVTKDITINYKATF